MKFARGGSRKACVDGDDAVGTVYDDRCWEGAEIDQMRERFLDLAVSGRSG